MFSKNGEALIAKALGQFEALRATLLEGVDVVTAKINNNRQVIDALEAENGSLQAVIMKARAAASGIEKLLSGK